MLLARSGGFCENPECNTDLFKFFANKTFVDVNEAAHIISAGTKGPRANDGPRIQLDSPENILLLCPSCHSLIDKIPSNFPASQLYEWKKRHEGMIIDLFSQFRVSTKVQLLALIKPILVENKLVFDTYGPSTDRQGTTISDHKALWDRFSVEVIVPNNRKILQILTINEPLFTTQELQGVYQFKMHKESFEIAKVTNVRNASTTMFPTTFFEHLLEKDNA